MFLGPEHLAGGARYLQSCHPNARWCSIFLPLAFWHSLQPTGGANKLEHLHAFTCRQRV